MITCTRRIQFCYGHRVWKHESKCNNLHGHNGVVFLHARAPELDTLGRIIDFGVLKAKLGRWIDTNWDHGFLFHHSDVATHQALEYMGPGQKTYVLPYNPTAENMAKYLLHRVAPEQMVGTGVQVYKVVLWETENCFATATLDD
jgi:6-pyruvoyltetrahydropterin/6-carboxytetrahydropterin synthase